MKDYCLHKIKIREKLLFLSYEDNNENSDDGDLDKKLILQDGKSKENDFYLTMPLYKINIELLE